MPVDIGVDVHREQRVERVRFVGAMGVRRNTLVRLRTRSTTTSPAHTESTYELRVSSNHSLISLTEGGFGGL